jgi:hypothetical protein
MLADQKTLPTTGIVVLSYSAPGRGSQTPRIGYVNTGKPRPKKKGSFVAESGSNPRRKSSKTKGGKSAERRTG